jgi:hypothetical protein
MFRVILSFGDRLPTKIFGGDYPTLKAAEKAKRNIESTTHYTASIEEIEHNEQDQHRMDRP